MNYVPWYKRNWGMFQVFVQITFTEKIPINTIYLCRYIIRNFKGIVERGIPVKFDLRKNHFPCLINYSRLPAIQPRFYPESLESPSWFFCDRCFGILNRFQCCSIKVIVNMQYSFFPFPIHFDKWTIHLWKLTSWPTIV